ncbi:hypothetical protein IKD82_01680 [Candidatus Saccharibacteria bacterium]|nr:hypothetical protein [Candidatus Saccharibacteria bacterium]
MQEEGTEKSEKKENDGGRNLVILGVLATVVALLTTTVSLIVYHNSGDIYLDRSRPGFLPDEEETQKNESENEEFSFEKSGKITAEALDELLKNLDMEIQAIDFYENPFGEKVLSDESLGIPEEVKDS